MSRKSDQAGTFELLARLPQQIVHLAKIEFQNAKREIAVKAKRGGIGAIAIVVALFFVFFALEAFVIAAIAGLAVVWPVWLSALVVAAGLILLAAAAILGGVLLIKRGIPVPGETMSRVEGDINALGEVRVNSDHHGPIVPEQKMPQTGQEGNWR
ncbi:phage holin family protein [Leucobacter sp. CSA1]|uniref:Phage holin family protein n=1 Tax=Leucobacter chromiisoli TaxID=2796471 RepID=A0A934Q6C1_9MICO|nr:phage holin family protein [Leucobacter chromiisoli]MBK0417504.1 phage holin family protein [Leucobacter chromiisoli]